MSQFGEIILDEAFLQFKVQLFWEGHKNGCNRPYGFEIYLVNVKTLRTIAQIFVAFSEKLNFTTCKYKHTVSVKLWNIFNGG